MYRLVIYYMLTEQKRAGHYKRYIVKYFTCKFQYS